MKWYYVPPYNGADHKVVNEAGEHVATFEDRDEAKLAVDLYNTNIHKLNYQLNH